MRSVRCIAAALAAGALACASRPPAEPVGVTTHHGTIATPSASGSASVPKWSHAKELETFTRANARRFPSSGHYFGRYDADVLVNDVARDTYAHPAPGTSAKPGAVIVKVHLTRAGEPGPVLAMEKTDAGWTYVEMDSALRVLRKGRLSPCVDCHAHVGSQDELFGVPLTGR